MSSPAAGGWECRGYPSGIPHGHKEAGYKPFTKTWGPMIGDDGRGRQTRSRNKK